MSDLGRNVLAGKSWPHPAISKNIGAMKMRRINVPEGIRPLSLTLSLVRDCRKAVSSLKVRCMEYAREEMPDALSLTRERVRVWVSENLSLQKLNNAEKKDRHPLPPLSHRKMGEGTENVPFGSLSQRFAIFRQSLVRDRKPKGRCLIAPLRGRLRAAPAPVPAPAAGPAARSVRRHREIPM